MKKLTNKKQIEVLENVKKELMYNQVFHKDKCFGLCTYISNELNAQHLKHLIIRDVDARARLKYSKIRFYIPIFTRKNAIKYGEARKYSGYWWNVIDKDHRIKFLDWMIKELQILDTNL